MGREKRKTRLNKGESGEFIGFGAFAAPAPAAAATNNNATSPTKSSSSSPSLTLAPVYMGSDASLSIIFPRIGQKRDATTKTKALVELRDFFGDESQPKKSQVDALAHFLYLFHSKLHYESTASVRAAALECCAQATIRVPKAWKTLTQEQQPEILGMILCSRADPAADVRLAANKVTTLLIQDQSSFCEQGLWDYVQRITSYGKAMTMHEELFQKRSGETSKLSENQKEESEERFERILGTALGGVRLFLLDTTGFKTATSDGSSMPDDLKFLWKTLANSKPSLRLKTYHLLSAACQKIPNSIDAEKLSKQLSQALSSEKEAANIPALLETLLSFVAQHKEPSQRTETIAQYTKPLTKLFKKGCHGATQWAPTVLPIVALMPTDEQPAILTSVWEGRSHLVGVADSLQVAQAVAETATFLMQRPHSDLAQVTAKCWLQALQTYLTTQATGAALRAQQELGKSLAKDLGQLNSATYDKPNSSICHFQDWFWKEELVSTFGKGVEGTPQKHVNARLSELWNQVSPVAINEETENPRPAYFSLALTEKFRTLLKKCQGASGLVPSLDIYELWMAILKHVSINKLLGSSENEDGSNSDLERFVMNDLLRWMVIHTSALSEQATESLAKLDFTLYWHCMTSNSDKTSVVDWDSKMWNSILRELIAAKCDLQYLAAGLALLVKQGCSVQDLRSNLLDDLCLQVAREAVEPLHSTLDDPHHDEAAVVDGGESISHASTELHMEYHQKTSDFLQACSGSGEIDESLVGAATVESWIDIACPKDHLEVMDFSPVLETLVALVRSNKLPEQGMRRTTVQCWRQGGDIWQNEMQPWLEKNSDLGTEFIGLASKELNSIVRQVSSEAKFDSSLPADWAGRAFRLLEYCQGAPTKTSNPSMSMVGLSDINLWQRKEEEGDGSFIAQCLLTLFTLVQEPGHRWQLISNAEADSNHLTVQVLMSLSGASTDVVKSSFARRRRDACAELLEMLGGKSIDASLVDGWCRKCVSILSSALREGAPQEQVSRGIAVVSQLLELILSRLRPSPPSLGQDDTIQAEHIKKGDSLWYITNAQEPSKREPCTVVKIHTDLPEELYFTVATKRDGVSQERQTVLARLRQNEYVAEPKPLSNARVDHLVSVNDINGDAYLRRERMSQLIIDELVNPSWDTWPLLAYEILNILISHSGLLGQRGVGTLHFTILQRLTTLQSGLRGFFAAAGEQKADIILTLKRLSLALGYGWNTPPARGALSILGFSATDSLEAITEYYNDNEPGIDSELDEAVATWLAVAAREIENADLRDRAHSLMFQIAAHVFQSCNGASGFVSGDLVAMRAMHAAQVPSHESTRPGESVVQDDEAVAIKEMVNAFACRWECLASDVEASEIDLDDESQHQPLWSSLPVVNSVLESSFIHRSALVGAAARCYTDSIVSCLGHASKRYTALRLIRAYVNEGIPLHEDPFEAINETTAARLPSWSKGLVEEESEELEEDVGIVAQWIPKQLMIDAESWHGSSNDVEMHDAFVRMALWLTFLDIADAAARKGTLIRPALTSYIRYSKSADAMLDLAIAYGNAGSDGKLKLDTGIVDIKELFESNKPMMELVKVAASTVVFRTVEVLPTVSKTWWEVECPGYCSQAVKEFVESTVSPQILRRELDRIKRYTAFGDMMVRGSAVSREVTALYVQDDFTLTAIIKLPPSFPFGRAEVDTSKTLGVPEQRSKRWSLQISLMLNNQGGTLIDALILWKENVDKEFEGVEPCPVCYSVLHVKTHKLPEMQCKTCSNRFHFDCLTQWFRSSGKSACVLCQQPWAGTRVT